MRFLNRIENYIVHNLWYKLNVLSLLLVPCSIFYWAILQYKRLVSKVRKADINVICIGNIVVGGAGKTPIAIAIAKVMQARGKAVAFIGHGYKAKQLDYMPCIVVDKDIHNAADVGDEALLLNQIAPTYLAKDRLMAINAARAEGAEVVIMDDGMQDFTIKKDSLIVVIDAKYLLGNRFLLPAGPLREPAIDALKRADFVVVSGHDDDEVNEAIDWIILKFGLQINKIANKMTKALIKPTNIDALINQSFIAMTGIANPEKFFGLAAKHCLDIKYTFRFPDHHLFTREELEQVYHQAGLLGCKVLTTSKDFVRLPREYHGNTMVLDIEAEITDLIKYFK